QSSLNIAPARIANIDAEFLADFKSRLGLEGDIRPEDIFCYAYAVFFSPAYRNRYSEFLRNDFPRLPMTGNVDLFSRLSLCGSDLVGLHNLDSAAMAILGTTPINVDGAVIEGVKHSSSTVWIDKAQARGFRGVPDHVWNFHIGGYQVCERWLKDRKGR